MGIIMDGKKIAEGIRAKLAEEIRKIEAEKAVKPTLATIIVEGDPSSAAYVKNKEKVCIQTGLGSVTYNLPMNTKEEDLIRLIEELNIRKDIHGILVQVPLPKHINENKIASIIDYRKDVDCFNPENAGRLFRGEKCLLPCTPKGIIRLIKAYGIEISGKKAAVVGRSNIVGKPCAMMLLNNNATVTICHSKTFNLKSQLLECDIIVSAVGKPGLITADMVKEGAVVIDAGTTMVDGKLKGDVDFEKVLEKASYITPVPGGVGAMTTTMLIENVLEAFNNYE
ncbi:bifunctional 5,10-methylenetetrahydrofolate dehydrogenase/5,10-methenyltetrahydrofolate cyclohydrolase [Caloramator sp. E03]|uniref:bifunctional 5,10-methylenetetrahydrofolate dehydrogenase/5,10-methenyltetrahydrofolate cyclohydrolase n=1 Tax=Caloramator sp. E03 TaxID=2576307 RepID=UPI001110ACD6|nr:bifunctional 5,10-methylenetetrahydrofolate dehydrogenase/5,10-methenyltetrahydrofolate cyclohydrolase [Caloramator sp. E03]QCX32695.1 bifunctional 5,10-methylenetetrahydrofolate dehydrogenase/5,10-methenyltetrahydrofolate cyclohydrolase [Caloramator sp. E03]